jgi:hypothetical protein
MQIICYISLADFVGNAFYIPSYRPSNGSISCSLEGFFNLYAYPVSWLWSTVLMYFLYSLAVHGRLPLSMPVFHVICWGLPLLLTLLNLTTNTYGRSDDYPEYEVCSLGGNYFDGFWWHTITYYCLWLLCIVLMGIMYLRISCLRTSELAIAVDEFRLATKTLVKYPIALFVFWLPHMIGVTISGHLTNVSDFYVIALVIKNFHGVATALIFFADSSEARTHWSELFNRILLTLFPATAADKEDLNRASISSVDPSRWGDKLYSLTYEVHEDESKLHLESIKNVLNRASLGDAKL